jgi:hypothetical protein
MVVRCVHCRPRAIPYDPDALRRLARRERKRLRTHVAVVVAEVLAEETDAFSKWPPELVTTVRVLDRWGAFGSGMPAENPDAYSASLPPPLDPDTQVIVTSRIDKSPPRVRKVTYDIWWSGAPTSYVGQKIGMKPRTFKRYLEDCVRVHRKSFLASAHPDLVNLVSAPPV